jgi:conjugal transfer/type IV secretion protein DotA/TraY
MISSLTSGVAFLGLTAGLTLYYVLPFLPFVYYFFAVGTWLMTIFEAIVGVPLWALAHLRLDGEGLPGDAASNGYFLIFEIFFRPILTVICLIGALIIFTAQVRVLNMIWGLVVGNLTGHEGSPAMLGIIDMPRDVVDQFFYTVLYAAIVYMMATASFKLIDKIPDSMMRFIGSSATSFNDTNPDEGDQLSQYVATSGFVVGQQITGAITKSGRELGGVLSNIFK